MVGTCKAGDAGSEIAGACYWVSRKVESWASLKQSQRMPTFVRCGSPLLRCTKTQGGRGDGGRLELSYIAVGSCWTVEAVKPTEADGKDGVECVGVFCVGFFPFASN